LRRSRMRTSPFWWKRFRTVSRCVPVGDIYYAFIKKCRGFITMVARSSNLIVGAWQGWFVRSPAADIMPQSRIESAGAIGRDISLPKA
jgi:hypothetical protein